MRIALVQTELAWEQPAQNRRQLAEKLTALIGQADLILLPEMFTTGFSMNAAALAEPMDGPTAVWMTQQADRTGAALVGSFICREHEHFYNRLLWVFPDGRMEYYDKRHLFALAGEDQVYTAGNKKLIINWAGFRVLPLVCYDLRFPVWSRYTPEAAYDLLLYVANWPSRRSQHWKSLLPARAIENQSFVAALNIVGQDGAGLEYQGDSAVIDFSGHPIVQISGQESVVVAKLSLDSLQRYRQQLPFLSDADAFTWGS